MLTESQRLRNMDCPEGRADIVIDSDTYNEIDDQFAISYALFSDLVRKLTDRDC